MKTLFFFTHLLKTSIRASIAKKGAFLVESSLMMANNLIFLSLWWIFFRQFPDVSGWQFREIVILTVVGMGSYGLMQVCFGGVRHLSRMIINGELDPFMTKPKNLLLHIAASKSFAKGWGHLMTAAFLIILGGLTTLSTLPLVLFSILSGCLVFTSFNILANSLAFWMGPVEDVAKKYCDALCLLALYPAHIYSGLLQIVMFTLIPAGLISYLPIELIRAFSWPKLLILFGASFSFFAIALFTFHRGLRRYESGNTFTPHL